MAQGSSAQSTAAETPVDATPAARQAITLPPITVYSRRGNPPRPATGASAPAEPLPDGVVLNGGPPVDQTTAGPVSGYRALTSVSATKTGTPIERIPQAVAVIPRAVIDDQRPLTQSEALRNVSGVTGMPMT